MADNDAKTRAGYEATYLKLNRLNAVQQGSLSRRNLVPARSVRTRSLLSRPLTSVANCDGVGLTPGAGEPPSFRSSPTANVSVFALVHLIRRQAEAGAQDRVGDQQQEQEDKR